MHLALRSSGIYLMVNLLKLQRSVLTHLRTNFLPLHYFWRNMCISNFVPLRLNADSRKKEQDIKELYEISTIKFKPTREEILTELLDLNEGEVANLLNKNMILRKYNSPDYFYNIQLVKKHLPDSIKNLDSKFWISILKTNPITVQHRLCFIKEVQISEADKNLFKLPSICKLTIKDLRSKSLISMDDFPHKIFCELEVPQRILDSCPSKNSYNERTLKELWLRLTWMILNWQIGLSYEEFLKQIKNYNLGICSLNLILQNIIIMKKYLEMGNEKIVRNLRLLFGSPERYIQFLTYEKKMFSTGTITLAQAMPLILLKPLHTIQEIAAILEFVNVKMNIINCPRIFTYAKSTLLERIVYYIRKTSLDDFRLTPSNIFFILRKKECFEIIKSYEKEYGCIQSLPSGTSVNLCPSDFISPSMKIMRNNIYRFLNYHFNIHKNDSCKGLNQIGLIHLPELHNLKLNLVFLLNNDFSMDLIKKSFHIIIYPHEIVVENFNNLSFTKYGDLYKQNNDKDKLLQLLLYQIYKEYKGLGGSYL